MFGYLLSLKYRFVIRSEDISLRIDNCTSYDESTILIVPLEWRMSNPDNIFCNSVFKSSSEDDDEDYLSYLDQPPASSKAVTNNIHQLPQSQNSSVKTFASGNNQNTKRNILHDYAEKTL